MRLLQMIVYTSIKCFEILTFGSENILVITPKLMFYSYVWAASGKQPDLEKSVGVGGYGYPALVALNVKKGIYTPLKSAFELDHIM